ncbi:ADP-ribosylglycohydrolase family protein [Ottowia testudinis]|uniref:ADP-ribosylglycohydrolase family protein n=1 Tax=Ottowia testudinis TaxID=2816950 RepID=A0A975CH51_9BURK|nr:ADP-ribosylglycohydrolase family protein [Ottowia testudinis]QTD46343.1 ADP-ribosylglycohydrolase family protein [Ottowia testudinis]
MTSAQTPQPKLLQNPSPDTRADRIRACLLGGAVGDALGAPVEFMSRAEILKRFGPEGIQDYAPAYGRLGAITDDTQMTLFTAEGILQAWQRYCSKGICHTPSVMGYAYQRWLRTQGVAHALQQYGPKDGLIRRRRLFARRAPGITCLEALQQMQSSGDPARNDSKGCGGVMRVAPIGLLHAALISDREHLPGVAEKTFQDAAEAAALTHGHPTGQWTAGCLAVMVLHLVWGATLDQAVEAALDQLQDHPHTEETRQAIQKAVDLAQDRPSCPNTLAQLGEGWVAEEALAISLYCALGASDFAGALRLAVNHDGDSDSTGSITGQLLGAKWGTSVIPAPWLKPLELRDVIEAMAQQLAHPREES